MAARRRMMTAACLCAFAAALGSCDDKSPTTPAPTPAPAAKPPEPSTTPAPAATPTPTPAPAPAPAPAPTPAPAGMVPAQSGLPTTPVRILGETFNLEIAADDLTRFRGLSGRTEIPPDGGMIFVFPDHLQTVHSFVMRDCPVPIDIAYLDAAGRVLRTHAMVPDPPRGPGEGVPGQIVEAYEQRLTRYSSRYPARFAVELKGGTIARLGLKEGEQIQFDVEGLKKKAK